MEEFDVASRISYLIAAHLNAEITSEEQAELDCWLDADINNKRHFEQTYQQYSIQEKLAVYHNADRNAVWQKIVQHIKHDDVKLASPNDKRIRIYKYISIAASIIFIGFISTLFFLPGGKEQKITDHIAVATQIMPGKDGATLTFSDGRVIAFDDLPVGHPIQKNGMSIVKSESGEIQYELAGEDNNNTAYHIIETARAEQIKIRLPDGTLVFLNAASSLKLPANFGKSKERRVVLHGEAYFEVAHHTMRPFIVHNENQEVTVLGTIFNISCYKDEPQAKTTLIEGSVRIKNLKSNVETRLVPGQQAILSDQKMVTKPVQTEDVVDWKNGYFMFNHETLASMMKKIARWYDIEVIYNDATMKDKTFFGSINKYSSISQLIHVLEKTEVASFEIKGRQLIISSIPEHHHHSN